MSKQNLFSKIPNIEYDISLNDKPKLVKNIFISNKIVDKFSNDPVTHYEYTIRDGEDVFTISELYYDDPRYYWVILLFNDIRDYISEWPKSPASFSSYINSVYGDVQSANSTPYYYYDEEEKISVQTYNYIKNWFTSNFEVPLQETTGSKTPNFNSQMTYSKFSKFKKYSMYDYENEKNEKNRVIKLLRSDMIQSFVEDFQNVIDRG